MPHIQVDLLVTDFAPIEIGHVVEHATDLYRAGLGSVAGKIQGSVGDLHRAFNFAPRDRQVLWTLFLRAVLQQMDHGNNRFEWILDFVSNTGGDTPDLRQPLAVAQRLLEAVQAYLYRLGIREVSHFAGRKCRAQARQRVLFLTSTLLRWDEARRL